MADQQATPNGTVDEIKAMVTDYAKQQTLDPLKRLGDWAKFGLVGALLLCVGGFLVGLGILRLVQTMEWTDEKLSFVPYAIAFAVLIALSGACFYAMTKRPDWLNDEEAA